MRAPQFGHKKGKRRADNTALPYEPKRFGRYVDGTHYAAIQPVGTVRYAEPAGTKVTLRLWHKSAMVKGVLDPAKQGPIVTKAAYGSKEKRQVVPSVKA